MKRSLFWLLDQYPETGESIAAVHQTALDQAAEADRLGFTSLWLAEHHFEPLGTAANPAVLLAAIAQRTKTLRLGAATAVLPLRNPIHVAEDYALVDALSRGRLNMGVGSGSQADEFGPFGVDFDDRKSLFDNHLRVIRQRWQAAARGETGPTSLNVAPVQTPTPPVYVATSTEETAYQIGREGDSLLVLVSPMASGLDDTATRVRAHARGLKDRASDASRSESVVMVFAHVADTEGEVRATVVPALSRLLKAMTGVEPDDARVVYEQMRKNDVGLFGPPTEVEQQIQRFDALGMRHLAFVSRFGGMSKEASTRSLRLLAPLPQV